MFRQTILLSFISIKKYLDYTSQNPLEAPKHMNHNAYSFPIANISKTITLITLEIVPIQDPIPPFHRLISPIETTIARGKKGDYIYKMLTTPQKGTKQACLFRDRYTPLTASGLSIYGLSTDSPKANTTFKEKQKLPYPLLCDPSASLIGAIGLKKTPKGTTRGVFVVDKGGKVLAAEPGGPDGTVSVVEKIVEQLKGDAPAAGADEGGKDEDGDAKMEDAKEDAKEEEKAEAAPAEEAKTDDAPAAEAEKKDEEKPAEDAATEEKKSEEVNGEVEKKEGEKEKEEGEKKE